MVHQVIRGAPGHKIYGSAHPAKVILGQRGPAGPVGPAGTAVAPLRLSVWVEGKPEPAEYLAGVLIDASVTIDEAKCKAVAGTGPSSQAVFNIRKNGSPFGTVTFAASQTNGVVDFSGSSLAEDDILSVEGPDPQDGLLSDVSILIYGNY